MLTRNDTIIISIVILTLLLFFGFSYKIKKPQELAPQFQPQPRTPGVETKATVVSVLKKDSACDGGPSTTLKYEHTNQHEVICAEYPGSVGGVVEVDHE